MIGKLNHACGLLSDWWNRSFLMERRR